MGDEKGIILIVISGTLLMLLFIITIVLFVVTYNKKIQQKNNEHRLQLKSKELEMLKRIIESQETEKDKIASNLHDEVGPLLSKLKLDMSSFKRAFEKGTLTADKLNQEREFIDVIIENVRLVSHDLSPQFILRFGLVKAIQNYCSNTEKPKVTVVNEIQDLRLSRNIAVNTYRILLEVLNNIIKHDTALNLEIKFSKIENILKIEINHDGEGISNEEFQSFAKQSKGIGLESIRSRILILNAILDFKKNENANSKVELSIPLT